MRAELIRKYFVLGSELEELFPDLDFKNHCYWRIALDNTLCSKWSDVIDRPAYKHLPMDQLKQVVWLLMQYSTDRELLLVHNTKSLQYRNKSKSL